MNGAVAIAWLDLAERRLPLVGKTFSLGRAKDNNVVFTSNKVSRRHARIWSEGETFLVEDLGSVNGTVINDSVRLAPRQPRVLDSGDKIRLGETTLHFLVG